MGKHAAKSYEKGETKTNGHDIIKLKTYDIINVKVYGALRVDESVFYAGKEELRWRKEDLRS